MEIAPTRTLRGEDRFAFSNLAARGLVDEVSQHGEAYLHLAGIARAGRAATTRHIRADGGHTAAGLRMIPMIA